MFFADSSAHVGDFLDQYVWDSLYLRQGESLYAPRRVVKVSLDILENGGYELSLLTPCCDGGTRYCETTCLCAVCGKEYPTDWPVDLEAQWDYLGVGLEAEWFARETILEARKIISLLREANAGDSRAYRRMRTVAERLRPEWLTA